MARARPPSSGADIDTRRSLRRTAPGNSAETPSTNRLGIGADGMGAAGAGADSGFVALELAVMTSFLIVMLLLMVGLGRVSHGRQLIDQAGAAAARAAALDNTPGQATIDAQQAAADTLEQAGLACGQLQVNVDVAAFHPGGYVQVSVRCTADLTALALAGLPGSVLLRSSSRSPLETYRDFTAAAG